MPDSGGVSSQFEPLSLSRLKGGHTTERFAAELADRALYFGLGLLAYAVFRSVIILTIATAYSFWELFRSRGC
ncbi:hypothetical protein J2Z49_001909 [Desulfofundulus luciae]|uniref:Uncharacterized protein n=1 Tax=Desulfofundulus luciae TaxID=74702 RepID=A0ABU0B3E0_9FIRM|nr:hypothetical protein [Desulfofundulus luciae]